MIEAAKVVDIHKLNSKYEKLDVYKRVENLYQDFDGKDVLFEITGLKAGVYEVVLGMDGYWDVEKVVVLE